MENNDVSRRDFLRTTAAGAVGVFAAPLMATGCAQGDNFNNEIVIDLKRKGATIAPSMYGIFFEEINHAGDGGLYAELVQNRSFEDGSLPEGFSLRENILVPPPVKNHLTGKVNQIEDRKMRWNPDPIRGWSLQTKTPNAASIKVTKERPNFDTAPHNLEVTVNDASDEVAVVNSGFWGMSVEADENYFLRVIIRVSPEYNGTVEARLLSQSGETLVSCPIETTTPREWNDFRSTVTSKGKDGKASLAIVFNGRGKVWLDYVSLFPENTFMGRKNGLRKDLAKKIADLKPAFVRWPGGTIVGGITLSTRMNWKNMLGDPASRPGEIVTWGYRNSYGFGYYEVLQFCEDIGADFMYVCNVGLGDQYRMGDACPEDKIEFYVNDCLNAIEYAIGDVSTTWGARRAADGHPEPFSLKYVEPGNEHWGAEYNRRFAIFHDAIKARYPTIEVIYNAHGFKPNEALEVKADLVDPHFYNSVESYLKMNNFFDNHPRGKYRVYVGEYACHPGFRSGNMAGALAEAAFIDGMERNGDLVTMTSYAPLLENVNYPRWAYNLIRFNSETVIGRSSYYVQKMVSINRPDYNVWNSLNDTKSDAARLHAMSSGTEEATGELAADASTNDTKNDMSRLYAMSSGIDEKNGELVVKFMNISGDAYPVNIKLNGAKKIAKSGKVTILSAEHLNDENTIEEPRKIYPQESEFNRFGKSFAYEFEAYSYTVLRIPVVVKS